MPSLMRVLHISPGKLFGGVETLQVTMARYRGLCAEMEPEFAVCFPGRLLEALQETGAFVHPLGEVRVGRPLTLLRGRAALQTLIRERRYDVVICHMPWTNAVFGRVVRSQRLPLVFWMHGVSEGRHWVERWSRLTRPDYAICPSEFTLGTLPNLFPGLSAAVLSSPVPAPDQLFSAADRAAIRTELATSDDEVVIVQVSRMDPMKGHFLHLEALRRLATLPGWTCWMIGGAQRPAEISYFERLKETAVQLGIAGRVRFAGERRDVPRLLAAADIYCQPNISPEAGRTVGFAEAMYAGLPVVSTRIGGFWEMVDDSCGRLVAPENPAGTRANPQILDRKSSTPVEVGRGRSAAGARDIRSVAAAWQACRCSRAACKSS